jgi:biotin carboxylase
MSSDRPVTVLCIASYEKGADFMRECKRLGCRVLLLTSESLQHADWPRESLDEIYFVPDVEKAWILDDVLKSISYLCRTEKIDRIVPLDDFDLEKAAALREHLRVPGLGETTTRYFRDKLAMRMRAKEAGIPVPEFIHALNYDSLREFMEQVPAPWLIKPRFEASATGITKLHQPNDLWPVMEKLGDRQSHHLVERYVPGDIFHVDSIVTQREIVFSLVSRYGHPPLDVAHGGGIFTTRTIERDSADDRALKALNRRVLEAMGLRRGVSHTEFIKAHSDGSFYFLETAARVGGANIADLVEAASGVNLWAEWARIEVGGENGAYELPPTTANYAGILVSLARQEWPDLSAYNDPEVVWRLKKKSHAGLIVMHPELDRVEHLLDEYARRFREDFFATLPARTRPVD